MLSMNEKNCSRYSDAISQSLKDISSDLKTAISTDYPEIADDLKKAQVTSEQLCDYLTWAHFNAVPLKGDKER